MSASTTSITLSSTFTKIADGSGTITAQLRSQGHCHVYIGDTAPSDGSPYLSLPADGMTVASAVTYVKGAGTLVYATVTA